MIGYQLKRAGQWGSIIRCDDFKDMAVQVVQARDSDPTVEEYATLERRRIDEAWERIGGSRRDHNWSVARA